MQGAKQKLSTEEELFCTKYELKIISGVMNQGQLERWVPGCCSPHTHKEHESRYSWVKNFVKDKNVLDVACGAGFGSYIIAEDGAAAKVTGWDIDKDTIHYASIKNRHPNISFEVKNAETFDTNQQYDVIVSFETIEHLSRPDFFLNSTTRALTVGGVCFISTPISNIEENIRPDNMFHQREWGFKKFHELVEKYLRIEEVYLQLYSNPPGMKRGFFSKVLQKAGLSGVHKQQVIEKLTPFKWDPRELKEEVIGTEWTGYQILKCSK